MEKIWITMIFMFSNFMELLLGKSNAFDYTISQDAKEHCSFFSNREPVEAPDLNNCSWYQPKSCCRQVELDSIFRDVRALQRADDRCQNIMTYMLCWVCDPGQHKFYSSKNQTLALCEPFCNAILERCGTALFKGIPMNQLYQNGRHFCISHHFKVPTYQNESCFSAGGASADWQIRAAASMSYPSFFSLFSFLLHLPLYNQIW